MAEGKIAIVLTQIQIVEPDIVIALAINDHDVRLLVEKLGQRLVDLIILRTCNPDIFILVMNDR